MVTKTIPAITLIRHWWMIVSSKTVWINCTQTHGTAAVILYIALGPTEQAVGTEREVGWKSWIPSTLQLSKLTVFLLWPTHTFCSTSFRKKLKEKNVGQNGKGDNTPLKHTLQCSSPPIILNLLLLCRSSNWLFFGLHSLENNYLYDVNTGCRLFPSSLLQYFHFSLRLLHSPQSLFLQVILCHTLNLPSRLHFPLAVPVVILWTDSHWSISSGDLPVILPNRVRVGPRCEVCWQKRRVCCSLRLAEAHRRDDGGLGPHIHITKHGVQFWKDQ